MENVAARGGTRVADGPFLGYNLDVTNWDMLGNEWAVRLLQGHLQRNRVRHAYLFAGPAGVGRRTLALRLARALNCSQPPASGEYCGDCRDCRQIARMEHPDLAVVQPEEGSSTLRVEQVRELLRGLSLAPYQARNRVALLLHFEKANPSAANALLKTLEEPPAHVVLALTTESSEALLPTIVSRCEVLRLQPIPIAVLSAHLRERGLPPEEARLLAHISGGRPGAAHRLLEDPDQLERRAGWLDDLFELLKSGRVERFAYAEALSRDKGNIQEVLQVWASLWHDVLLKSAGAGGDLTNIDRSAQIEALASHCDLGIAYRAVGALLRARRQVESSVNDRLAVEVLMLDLPRLEAAIR